MNLSLLIDVHAPELVRRMAGTPDVGTLLRRLQAILEHESPPPYFARLPLERFLSAIHQLEEGMLTLMTWETEPDPVARAHGRARLRQALSRLVHEYAAGVDQEVSRLARVEGQLADQLSELRALLRGVLSLSNEGILGLNQALEIELVSPQTLEILQRSGALEKAPGQELLGQSLFDLLPSLRGRISGACSGRLDGELESLRVGAPGLSWHWVPLVLERAPTGARGIRSLLLVRGRSG